jgi:hypothetical protein
MKTRATLALAVAAGLPAAVNAQETFVVSYSLQEVVAGSTTAITNPNGVIDQGEGARITVSVQAMLNTGGSAIGASTTYPAPFPPGGNGNGTVKGLGSVVYDLIGSGGDVDGGWSQRAGPLANSPFTNGITSGTIQGAGGRINGFGGAQVVAPEFTANGANSNVRVFIGTWNPASYAARTVNFAAAASELVPTGQQNSLLVAYGSATAEDPNFNVFTYDLYLGKYVGTNFGNGLNISVAPAPSSLALLGLGALVAGGRRRK